MEELKSLLQKNIEYTKLNHELLIKVRRYILIQQIFSILKIVIIVIPLILAIVYGLPFLKSALGTYGEVLDEFNKVTGGNGDSLEIIQQFIK